VKVLVDTSVWVAHFKQRNEPLVALLHAGWVVCHPHVVVEVACGTPPQRHQIIDMLGELETLPVATTDELLALLERQAIFGRGCGFVDLNLLASALLGQQALLWTLDKRLNTIAQAMGLAYRHT
jgi:predicted nucleic acid-binding protein